MPIHKKIVKINENKYEELKRKYVYKPIILDNPIASVGAGAGAFWGNYAFWEYIDNYIINIKTNYI